MLNVIFKVLLLNFVSLAIGSSVFAKDNNVIEIDSLLKDEQTELEILRKKIKKQELAITRFGKKESVALKNLRVIGNQLKLKERELNIYKWNYKSNEKKLLSMESRLKETAKNIEIQKTSRPDTISTQKYSISIYNNSLNILEENMLQCMTKKYFSINCLSCGIQRSIISLLRGDFKKSWIA